MIFEKGNNLVQKRLGGYKDKRYRAGRSWASGGRFRASGGRSFL